MSRLSVRGLDPAGGTPGQVATVGPLGNIVDFEDPAGGGSLSWFDVRDYGAVGDGTTDDTTAIDAAIAALNAAGGGVLYFPAGIYKVTAALTAIDVPSTVLGDGCADSHFRAASTTVRTNSRTIDMFTVGTSGHGTGWQGLSLVNNVSTGTPPTAGSAIHVLGGDGAAYDRLTVSGFYVDLDLEDGQEWTMQRCFIYSPVKYGIKVRHVDLTDGGDMGITNCQFLAGDYNADAAIRWESGGGLRLTNCKINTRASSHFQVGLDATFTGFTTVDLNVVACSFENVNGPYIKGRLGSFGVFYQATIVGNQFAYYSTTSNSAIDIDGWGDVTVVGNTFAAEFSGSSAAAVKLANVVNGAVGLNTVDGFAGGELSQTSCTNITVLGTTLTAEDVRDIIGTALVEGAGIDITVDDAGDTITIASTVTGLRPLTTESGGVPDFVWDDNNELVMTEAPG